MTSSDGESRVSLPIARVEAAPQGAADSVADGRPKPLDPRAVTVQRLGGAIATAVLAGVTFVGVVILVFSGVAGQLGSLLALAAWALFALALLAFSLLWPSVRYRYTRYLVNDDGIEIRSGVLWRSVVTVPRNRVQHTDVSQGPIERSFELATLVVYTAGTQHASVPLSGLAHATALAIRDHLIEGDDGDAV